MATAARQLVMTEVGDPYHSQVLSIFPPTAMASYDVRRFFVKRRVSYFMVFNVRFRRVTPR